MGDKRIRIEKSNIDEGKYFLLPVHLHCPTSDMRLKAIEFVQQKASRSTKFQDVDLAKELKKLFDDTFFPTWQCVVGKNFGSDISYEN